MRSCRPTSRILVVDDDRRLCTFLSKLLTGEGYAVKVAHDGRSMRAALADFPFDLIILDLSFPQGEDGLTLAKSLRTQTDTPFIMLSGKGAMIDKVVGLELGADDYVAKPFEPRELLARIRTVLRRAAKQISSNEGRVARSESEIEFNGWRLDFARHELLSPDHRKVGLTSQEFRLLEALVQRPGRILSRDQIMDIVAKRHWGPSDRSIDVLIGKLRRKLSDDARQPRLIKTVRGVGYMFVPDARRPG
jgi:two-component system, OmpR family, response regulator